MKNKKIIADRVYSKERDFDTMIKLIIDHKIEELVHTAIKVNTATSPKNKKGNDRL